MQRKFQSELDIKQTELISYRRWCSSSVVGILWGSAEQVTSFPNEMWNCNCYQQVYHYSYSLGHLRNGKHFVSIVKITQILQVRCIQSLLCHSLGCWSDLVWLKHKLKFSPEVSPNDTLTAISANNLSFWFLVGLNVVTLLYFHLPHPWMWLEWSGPLLLFLGICTWPHLIRLRKTIFNAKCQHGCYLFCHGCLPSSSIYCSQMFFPWNGLPRSRCLQ